MQPSPELIKLDLRLYEKEASGEILAFAKSSISQYDGVLFIGTAPDEWYEDYESILGLYQVSSSAGNFEIKVEKVKAYEEGSVGWAVDRLKVRLPNGTEIPFRHTVVFHKESGEWKIVHTHISIGVPNEKIGE